MLSESYEVDDIKSMLQTYSEYAIDSDSAFTTIIEDCIDVVKNTIILAAMDESYYDSLALKDKDNLSTREEKIIYMAEVKLATGEFLSRIGMMEDSRKDTETKSISFGGVSFSYNGIPSKYRVASMLTSEGIKLLSSIGYIRNISIDRNGVSCDWGDNRFYR